MSYVMYYEEPSEPSRQQPQGPRRRGPVRRIAARLRGRVRITVADREPGAEVASWFGQTAAGEAIQRLVQPFLGASLVVGVGVAALVGVAVAALADLSVTTVPALATTTTGFAVGVAIAFAGGGPVPALAGGLFGWLVGVVVESGVDELVKQPASRVAGVVLGWCLAALAGWVAGRVATLLPWPWVVAVGAVVAGYGVRWAVSCGRDRTCSAALAADGLAAAKWATVALLWLLAVAVLLWLAVLHRRAYRDVAALLARDRLLPFGLLYPVWWAPLLTVAALRAFTPGNGPTGAELTGWYVALVLPLCLGLAVPSLALTGLLPRHWPVRVRVTAAGPGWVRIRNDGRRTARRLRCRGTVSSGQAYRIDTAPGRLRRAESCTLALRSDRGVVSVTWREGPLLRRGRYEHRVG